VALSKGANRSMQLETGRLNAEPQVYRVTWFAPDRPVDGGTVYIRPPAEEAAPEVGAPVLSEPKR